MGIYPRSRSRRADITLYRDLRHHDSQGLNFKIEVQGLGRVLEGRQAGFGARFGDIDLQQDQVITSRIAGAGIEANGHRGLRDATTQLLDELKALPSAG